MWQRIKNWIIRKLGGYTEADIKYERKRTDHWYKVAYELCEQKRNATTALVTAQSEIKINPLFGYTEDNVITQAKARACYELGKAVYPYASHFIAPDGVYIVSVEVMKGEEN